ncbi:MAG: hypothetical protein M3O34_17680 [Chloroflexota bacterium]|nr:hypothetical protein [Chloroflexota bacterium]
MTEVRPPIEPSTGVSRSTLLPPGRERRSLARAVLPMVADYAGRRKTVEPRIVAISSG